MIMTFKVGILFFLWSCLGWCEEVKFVPPPAGINGWPHKAYDKVVGYQFANPDHVSFPKDGTLALENLKDLKRKESVLNADQSTALLKAAFETDAPSGGMLCYDPHHLIVFFSEDNPVGAIEICFSCWGIRSWPENKAIWWHTSLNDIGKLTTALGLGVRGPDPGNSPPKSGQQRFPVR